MARPPIPGGGGLGSASPSAHSLGGGGSAASQSASAPSLGGGPQLGGLFAGGMPTLRKTRGAAVETGRGQAPAAPSPPPPAPPGKSF